MTRKTHIVRQTERLKRGEINRRRFIMSALATGVTLPTATSLAQKAQAAQPKSGGALRIGAASTHRLGELRALATGNTLLEVGADGVLTGDLAASFEASGDGQNWMFDLREDISFSDETRFDAAAVVAALEQADTPGLRGQIKALRAEGRTRLVIDLIRPNPDFAWVLSDPNLTIRTSSGAGTGAYVPGRDARRLQKVADHWKTGRGHFESVDLIPLPDPAARLTALMTGEIDLMDDVDPGMFALLAHSPDIHVVEIEDAALYGFARQTGANARVARALNDVTDRRDLAQKVLLGHGRARGCTTCGPRSAIREAIKLAPANDAFPGAREMVSLVARMGAAQGQPIKIEQNTAHLKANRLCARPTLDWTLAEILAQHPDRDLEALMIRARAPHSADEKAALQEQALTHLEGLGHVYPLIANDIHAHRAGLTMPQGAFDPLRIAERAWFA